MRSPPGRCAGGSAREALLAARPGTADVADVAADAVAAIAAQLPAGWGDPDGPIDPWADHDAVRRLVSDAYYGTARQREALWHPLGRRLESALLTALGGDRLSYTMWDDMDVEIPAADYWEALQALLTELRGEAFLGPVWQLADRLSTHLSAPAPGDVTGFRVGDVVGTSPDPEGVVLWHEFGGYLDPRATASVIAAFESAARTVPLPGFPELDALLAAMQQVGRWWPLAGAAVLTDRPLRTEGRHAEYADGYST
ncbi:hypothetical protein OHA72_55865 [Dactylosporangium sp. NBC_01737]|uniref:hypothetical protein n=1 Tax=Dactylosporangium sp. NBC_01737 TaxID=2975959 RepID=UPI002E0FA4F6|nr:hypothetical protein OHA72_55865 [Dactylosporangium sp. NBC_01737]